MKWLALHWHAEYMHLDFPFQILLPIISINDERQPTEAETSATKQRYRRGRRLRQNRQFVIGALKTNFTEKQSNY